MGSIAVQTSCPVDHLSHDFCLFPSTDHAPPLIFAQVGMVVWMVVFLNNDWLQFLQWAQPPVPYDMPCLATLTWTTTSLHYSMFPLQPHWRCRCPYQYHTAQLQHCVQPAVRLSSAVQISYPVDQPVQSSSSSLGMTYAVPTLCWSVCCILSYPLD